jgi:hypothetical protein
VSHPLSVVCCTVFSGGCGLAEELQRAVVFLTRENAELREQNEVRVWQVCDLAPRRVHRLS